MPNQYEVVEPAATQNRTYMSKQGKELVVWNVAVKDEGVCELHKMPGNPPPAPGEAILARLSINTFQGREEKRLFLESQGNGASGGGTYRPRDPSETRAIQRQHSQEMALRYAAIKAGLGGVPADQFQLDSIRPIIDWFEKDISSERGEA